MEIDKRVKDQSLTVMEVRSNISYGSQLTLFCQVNEREPMEE